ncbi:MAG: hypothetical protein M1818_007921 [Claussenomyces sp. TS43310]|nr:MAG: hypothetical protein M1818_007921 [Claussenomyces sp. TS43310]
MPTTCSRNAQNSPQSAMTAGSKRAATSDQVSKIKRSKTDKHQMTIEETIDGIETAEDDANGAKEINVRLDSEQQNAYAEKENETKEDDSEAREPAVQEREDVFAENESDCKDGAKDSARKVKQHGIKESEKTASDEVKPDAGEVQETAEREEIGNSEQIANNADSVISDEERGAAMPSSILEKGIIYFFFRGRVSVEDPQGVEDVARSYIVLRPLPLGAKIGEGPLKDCGNARLLALPKKVLPKSHRDRFLVFVEKANSSVKDLKEDFVAGSTYQTQTFRTSNVPAATPIAEGIYAITSTGRESHLAYNITVPEIGEVQEDLGLKGKGSYVTSVKNPTASAPANASFGKSPEYPESVLKRFRNLRWMPLEPGLLDYVNTQFLIIGEGLGNVDKAMEEQTKDKRDDTKDAPIEEMEQLRNEDSHRVEHLTSDDPIFADLCLSSKEYPKMQTTW